MVVLWLIKDRVWDGTGKLCSCGLLWVGCGMGLVECEVVEHGGQGVRTGCM